MRSRDYDEEQWNHYRERLTRRGLLDRDGELTDVGRDLKQRIEDATDRLALAALDALDDDEVEALFRALTPITRKVVAAGDVVIGSGVRGSKLFVPAAQLLDLPGAQELLLAQ